jgi:hypothetical protein
MTIYLKILAVFYGYGTLMLVAALTQMVKGRARCLVMGRVP